ncbi:hypothetical protein HPB50_023388 [Hyalomma asiaticum]|uniref:Uncharacterized protein n=1 Tax=Hyalomma asiaticum TaxID=266040 RepID=A0ACB7S3M5_HYAAI|nr:hypothetical protein HPB50_023388 [Hyalomma asiaticum]
MLEIALQKFNCLFSYAVRRHHCTGNVTTFIIFIAGGRFFVKPPPAAPRKDQTLGNVIISEAKDEKLEAHQVSALPFPFNNVSQFESVISHPVGSLWNPETSFRELTAPKVAAKIGQVIDPMDRDALIVKKKESVVDKLLKQKKAETKHKQQRMRWRKKK